jgi:hypothetical protein
LPAFPSYPQFIPVPVPDDVWLNTLADRTMTAVKVQPIRTWQGLIQPFASDEEARQVLRLLARDQAVDVAAGRITPSAGVHSTMPHAAESRLAGCDISFDVLALEFEPLAHPWIFSLSPAISRSEFYNHPHLRTDRILRLPSRTVHGLCMYSAAEFTFDRAQPIVPQALSQAAIFLAKHVVWQKTQRLFNIATGEMIHDGVGNIDRPFRPDSIWQVHPTEQWKGFWPGTEAENGVNHLKLDPEGECWCGRGLKYANCCRPEEEKLWRG